MMMFFVVTGEGNYVSFCCSSTSTTKDQERNGCFFVSQQRPNEVLVDFRAKAKVAKDDDWVSKGLTH